MTTDVVGTWPPVGNIAPKSEALAVPEPTDVVPPGWFENVAVPVLAKAGDWDALDDAEALLSMRIGFLDAYEVDVTEYEKALRLVEKRRGDLLGPVTKGQRTDLSTHGKVDDVAPATASRWRKIAEHWDDLLWPHVRDATKRKLVTQSHLLRLIVEHTPAKPDPDVGDIDTDRVRLLHGDFRERLLEFEPGSVDLIITDPPYPKEDLGLWSDLAQVSAKLLGPRGLLIAYTGQIFLPDVLRMLGEHLTYGWTFSLQLPGSGSRIMGRHIVQGWKPVVAYSTGTWPSGEWGDDVLISPKREKDDYAWKQNAAPARRLIERFTPLTGLVVDPFLGIGSFGIAATNARRRFIGCELDADRFEKASKNLGVTP